MNSISFFLYFFSFLYFINASHCLFGWVDSLHVFSGHCTSLYIDDYRGEKDGYLVLKLALIVCCLIFKVSIDLNLSVSHTRARLAHTNFWEILKFANGSVFGYGDFRENLFTLFVFYFKYTFCIFLWVNVSPAGTLSTQGGNHIHASRWKKRELHQDNMAADFSNVSLGAGRKLTGTWLWMKGKKKPPLTCPRAAMRYYLILWAILQNVRKILRLKQAENTVSLVLSCHTVQMFLA